MKIIAYVPTYNELRLLPWFHRWMRHQRIELFVIDNISNDGTREYLKKEKIRHCTIDTGGAFDLRPILQRMTEQIHTDKPDWFIYASADMFFVSLGMSITDLVKHTIANGHNMIALPQHTFYHTRKPAYTPPKLAPNPFLHNFHYRYNNVYTFISEYHPEVVINPDRIDRPDKKTFQPKNAAILEMNAAKTVEERMETLKRRKIAWQKGLKKNLGYHYRILAERGFIFSENEQTDIRTKPELYALFHKLQSIPIE